MPRGELTLFLGNMFAGKTKALMTKIEILREICRRKVQVFKPTTDTRSGNSRIKDFDGKCMDAIELPSTNPALVFKILRAQEATLGHRFDVLVFDEIQFFPADGVFFRVVNELLSQGYDIIAAGLSLDFRGEPFGSTLQLAGLAQNNCVWLTSYCVMCGKPASLPQRIIDGKIAPYDSEQELVGGKEAYEARCCDCHELPNRPVLDSD